MKHALHRWTNKLVDAGEAVAGEGYLCPVCHAPVSPRAGWERDAYFAHVRGTGSKDCELYHVGVSSANGYLLHQESLSNGPWQIEVGLRIAESGYPCGWGLELSIPLRDGGGGEIELDVGGRIQKVVLTGAQGPVRRVTAEPRSTPYIVTSIKPEESVLANRLTRTCDALSESVGTVFGEVTRPKGQPIPKASELTCGGRYVLVWGGHLAPVFPEELALERLQIKASWEAGIIEIPRSVSLDCKGWLQDFTGLLLLAPNPAFVAVWPPLIRRVSTRLLEVAPNTTLYLHAACLSDNGTNPSVVFARSGKQDIATKTNPGSAPFFKLTPETESVLQLSCRDVPELQLEIGYNLAPEELKRLPFPSVELTGKADDDTPTSVPLHDEKATAWLESVRSGAITLMSLRTPLHIEGRLSTGKNGLWTELDRLLPVQGDGVTEGRAILRTCVPHIVDALHNRTLDTKIDFGGFGRVVMYAASDVEAESAICLSHTLRARLVAYLAQLPRQANLQRTSVINSDQQLVETMLNLRPVCRTLAHYRALISELNAVSKREKKKRDKRGNVNLLL